MHRDTFRYVLPTDEMHAARLRLDEKAREFIKEIYKEVPAGKDRDFAVRSIRTGVMWAENAIVRDASGKARKGVYVT